MTVGQLIEGLKAFDPDLPVVLSDPGARGHEDIGEIKEVMTRRYVSGWADYRGLKVWQIVGEEKFPAVMIT